MNGKSGEQTKSRRKIFNKSKVAILRGNGAGKIFRYLQPNNLYANISYVTTETFLQTVDAVVRPRLAQPVFLNGRTALLIAKAEDAQAALPNNSEAENVVVMGDGHLDMAATYKQDTGERNKAIVAYAQELLD